MSEEIRYPQELDERKELFVVMHNYTVWKKVFFEEEDRAYTAVQMFYKGHVFKKHGNVLISKTSNARFTIMPLREYTKMGDLRYSQEWG